MMAIISVVRQFFVLLQVVLSFVKISFGAKILILHPLYAPSHVLTLHSVALSLADRGHQVDILKWKDHHDYHLKTHENITSTILSLDNSEGKLQRFTVEPHAAFQFPYDLLLELGISIKPNLRTLYDLSGTFSLFQTQCESLLSNRQLFNILHKRNYDVAIIDLIMNECGLALTHQLKIPIIGYWALPFTSWGTEYTTAFLPASHTPAYFSKLGHKMSFFERTVNLVWKIGSHLAMSFHFRKIQRSVQIYYPETPHPSDLLKNLNGMIINSEPTLDHPRLLPPTFINAGGMHIRNPKPLPKEIDEWMESSGNDGVVLFTTGFILDLKLLPQKLLSSFMEAFSRFPQKFLVKLDSFNVSIPSNVKVFKWIPQQDILGHPKTRAFITHCGYGGVLEAAYHGVPMIGMPLLFDQGDNLARIKQLGIAIELDKDTATTETIYKRLQQILYNPKYKRNAKRISTLIKDVPETPLERVIIFTEYIIRQKGAEHLKLASRDLNWIQYFSIDSVIFFFFLSVPIFYCIYKCATAVKRILTQQLVTQFQSNKIKIA